jgi:hypothetical protein
MTDILIDAYNTLLERVAGPDGVIVASAFDMPDMFASDIIDVLVGFEGVGIYLSMLGQLFHAFSNITIALFVSPSIVVIIWRLCVVSITICTDSCFSGPSIVRCYR